MRIEEVETTRWETSDGQTSDNQTDSVACGVGSTWGVLHGGGRFLDCARNDRGGKGLRKEV